tara:strand:+ start:190 stop:531 length:342 start_codon:yes stop_codon:yes gene_type:complete
MKLYHWTVSRRSVEKNGFSDGNERYFEAGIKGVWFADQILEPLDGVGKNSSLVTVEIPDDIIEPFEWKKQGNYCHPIVILGYREWCIPAEVVNKYKITFPSTYKDRDIHQINE